MNSDMDRLLAYRNYLAAEDHLDELINKAESSDEKIALRILKAEVIICRDRIMPEEKDSRYHCLVKHLATAYEACREVCKAENTADNNAVMSLTYEALIDALQRLWGRDIEICERCKKDESGRVQEESSADAPATIES